MAERVDIVDELQKLKKLMDDGILTQEEFDIQKKKLLYADNSENNNTNQSLTKTKFCKHCGETIDVDCIICPKCGKQVEELKQSATQIPINVNVNQNQSNANTNTNTNSNLYGPGVVNRGIKTPKDKWVALLLCFFLGWAGAHKFYEGKGGIGLLYLFTMGLFFIGWAIDFVIILTNPNPYYV